MSYSVHVIYKVSMTCHCLLGWCNISVDSAAALQTEGRAFEPGVVHYICGLLYKFAVFPRIFILQSERSGAAAQGFGEAIPKHTVAPWSAAFGGSPRRLNKPAVYDHSGRKTRHQTKPKVIIAGWLATVWGDSPQSWKGLKRCISKIIFISKW